MHYYNGIDAAKRIGISYKTLLRWIEKDKIRPEEGKTPTGQLVISGDQVEAARKEVLKERRLFVEDEMDIDISGQSETEIDIPEDLTTKVKALESQSAASGDLWQKTNAAMDTLGVLQENLRFEVVSQLGKFATIIKEQDERLKKLTDRIEQLESKKQIPQPPAELKLPADHVWLSGFADQHNISRNEARHLYDIHAIHGQPISKSARSYKHIAISYRGKRDFYIQFHKHSAFLRCDTCPHDESRQSD